MDFKEIKMNKILILGIALSLLFLSGSFFSIQAGCEFSFNGCPPLSSSFLCSSESIDKGTMTRQENPATYDTHEKIDFSNGFWQDMG